MKRTITSPKRVLAASIAICCFIVVSCSKDYCPTYMPPLERVKTMRGMEINGSWERKSVPSPKQEKRKYVIKADTMVAAGGRVVMVFPSVEVKEI